MGAVVDGVEEALTVMGVLLRLSRVKPALGLDGLFSAWSAFGASPSLMAEEEGHLSFFRDALAGVLKK